MATQNSVLQDLVNGYQADHSLPAGFYNDPQIYATDLQSLIYRNWIYAGHVSQLAEPGCYFLVDFGDESIIVVRGQDNQIRAFANVCRHRGSRVCLESSGKVRAFVCPYHAWAYDLSGQLRSRRSMPVEFDQSSHGLKPVLAEVVEGLIFINLDEHAKDLQPGLTAMTASLQYYQLASTKVARQQTFRVDANWKLAIENFMECYHCAPAHVEYSRCHALKSPRDYAALAPATQEAAARLGYQTDFLDNSFPNDGSVPYFYNRSSLYEPCVTGSKTGDPVAPLLGDIKEYGGGAADIMIGPLSYGILYPDHAVLYRFLPTDVQKTDMDIVWLVNENAEEGRDYQLDDLLWLWTVTTEADKTIILNNQKGVNSKYYEPGPFSEMETYTAGFLQWYVKQIDR